MSEPTICPECKDTDSIECRTCGTRFDLPRALPSGLRAVTGSVRAAADYYLSNFTTPSGTFIGTMPTEDFIQRAGELARVLECGALPAPEPAPPDALLEAHRDYHRALCGGDDDCYVCQAEDAARGVSFGAVVAMESLRAKALEIARRVDDELLSASPSTTAAGQALTELLEGVADTLRALAASSIPVRAAPEGPPTIEKYPEAPALEQAMEWLVRGQLTLQAQARIVQADRSWNGARFTGDVHGVKADDWKIAHEYFDRAYDALRRVRRMLAEIPRGEFIISGLRASAPQPDRPPLLP